MPMPMNERAAGQPRYRGVMWVLALALIGWLAASGSWGCDPAPSNETAAEATPDGSSEISQPDVPSEQPAGETTPEAIELKAHALGDFVLTVDDKGLQIARKDGTVLLSGVGGKSDKQPSPLAWRKAEPAIKELLGSYVFEEDAPAWSVAASLEATKATDKEVHLRAGKANAVITLVSAGVLRIHWTLSQPDDANRVIQTFACATDDRFFGGGARVHGTQHRGEILPNWTSEQGIGKLRRTSPSQGFPLKGGIHDTYLPVPFVMTQRGVGLLIENSHRSLFHLCPKDNADRWSVEVWHNELKYLVVDGPTPLDVLERLTGITGRPKLSPKWAFAPWMDATHGQQKVLDAAKKMRAAGIPSSIIWTEDWVGAFEDARGYHLHYKWNADTSLYPDIKGLTDQLHGMGFKFLGYFNPFLREGSPQWKEAHDKDYAIKDVNGDIVYFTGVFGKKTTLPDFTKKEVQEWAIGYMKAAVAMGFDGWMADYAEWLPLASKLSDGTDGHASHNLYPLMWQKVNKDALDTARPNGDYVFFARSGWAGAGGLAPVFWAGDQQTSFDDNDGLQTVIPLCIDAGMSGIPIITHDIAGYSSVGVDPTSKELFFRWTQLGAFSSIMRTHHGSYADQNWNWQKDAETTAMFKRYAELHIGLFPYRYTIAKEASERGWPMMRHLFLHYPTDDKVHDIKDQFLLGADLLVAPVVKEKAVERKVYLPAAKAWYSFLTGTKYDGETTPTIKAPIDEIPVFARAGAIIPTLYPAPDSQEPGVDTLASTTDANVRGIKDAESRPLTLHVFLGASGQFAQYDGTTYKLEHHADTKDATALSFSADGKALPTCDDTVKTNCWKQLGATAPNGAVIHLDATKGISLEGQKSGQKTFALNVANSPSERRFSVVVWW